MKLATLNDGTKDGQLIIVSKDLKTFVKAQDIVTTMQNAKQYNQHKWHLKKQPIPISNGHLTHAI